MKLSVAIGAALAAPVLALPSTTTASCSVRGYDKGHPTAYFYSTASKYRSQAACGSRCVSDSKCVSYAFGDNTCFGYTAAVYDLSSLLSPSISRH